MGNSYQSYGGTIKKIAFEGSYFFISKQISLDDKKLSELIYEIRTLKYVYKTLILECCSISRSNHPNRGCCFVPEQEVERKDINVAAIKDAKLPIIWVLGRCSVGAW